MYVCVRPIRVLDIAFSIKTHCIRLYSQKLNTNILVVKQYTKHQIKVNFLKKKKCIFICQTLSRSKYILYETAKFNKLPAFPLRSEGILIETRFCIQNFYL